MAGKKRKKRAGATTRGLATPGKSGKRAARPPGKGTAAAPTTAAGKAPAPPAPEADGRELLDMSQAIAMLKTTRPTFYRWLRAGKLKGMKVGRQWRFYREDIERFLRGQGPRIDLAADIGPLLRDLREPIAPYGPTFPAGAGGDEAMEAARLMIHLGAAMGASDVHVAAQSDGVHVRLRLDGVLHAAATYDARLHPAVVAAWKAMAACDIHETELPQDGRILIELPGISDTVDLRVSFLPAYGGEAVTARILRRDEIHLSFDRFDLAPPDLEKLLRHIESPNGVVLLTGPTGSGKTTTLYTCLGHLNRPEVKLVSIEDPVELAMDGVVQVAVRQHPSRTFPAACRAALRSDPDVIMVGEIRDAESANLCVQMALTGHLVLTTLHTSDAAGALVRLVEIGVVPFVVADATRLVVAQRLVRRLCAACSKPGTPDAGHLEEAQRLARTGGLAWDSLAKRWHEPVGCTACKSTGYRGRSLIAEMLEVTPEVGAALRRGAGAAELRTLAVGQGMTTMAAHGILRAAAGETSLAEVVRAAASL